MLQGPKILIFGGLGTEILIFGGLETENIDLLCSRDDFGWENSRARVEGDGQARNPGPPKALKSKKITKHKSH